MGIARKFKKNILVGTWNVAAGEGIQLANQSYASDPKTIPDRESIQESFKEWLGRVDDDCWVVAVALEELVPYPHSSKEYTALALDFWKFFILSAIGGANVFEDTATCQLGAIALVVFVRQSHLKYCLCAQGSGVPQGLAGLSNKGAAAVQLVIDGGLFRDEPGRNHPVYHLRFVACHLTPFAHKASRRDSELCSIFTSLSFPNFSRATKRSGSKLKPKCAQPRLNDMVQTASVLEAEKPATRQPFIFASALPTLPENWTAGGGNIEVITPLLAADYLFVLGDMNYRLELSPQSLNPSLESLDVSNLRDELATPKDILGSSAAVVKRVAEYDQLRLRLLSTAQKKGNHLPPLFEGVFSDFLPTYKYDIFRKDRCSSGSRPIGVARHLSKSLELRSGLEYNWTRIPGWCDRVLFFYQHAQGDYARHLTECYGEECALVKGKEDEETVPLLRRRVTPRTFTRPYVVCKAYYSVSSMTLSDHKPVAALFELSLPPLQYSPCFQKSDYKTSVWWTFESQNLLQRARTYLYIYTSRLYWLVHGMLSSIWVFLCCLVSRITGKESSLSCTVTDRDFSDAESLTC